ncbi:MAG: hypothetical protein IIV99_05740 [Oscillospiraceae bacterium]|nr:hypothetical protein [Oscillospiraceae bacterium]
MKKLTAIFLSLVFALSLVGCVGRTNNVEIIEWAPSEMYTDDEIKAAIDTVCTDFRHWKDCTLDTITYAGDDVSAAHIDWATRNGCDESLVLVSSFTTGSNPEQSLEKNETYDNYKWILVRKEGTDWSHVDHGY